MSVFKKTGNKITRQQDAKQKKQSDARDELKAINEIAGKSDAEIVAYFNQQVNDLASAKAAIVVLARAVAALARDRGVV